MSDATDSPGDALAARVLVLAPTGRDAELIARVLAQAHMAPLVCEDVANLCSNWSIGAGAAIVAEEALSPESLHQLATALAQQPPWSDFPLIILTGGGKTTRFSTRIVKTLEAAGNVSLLERPLRRLTLVSAVQSALRARRRQYQVRSLLDETRRAVRQRDQFLAMLGHELRNPMAAIRTAVEVINESRCQDNGLIQEQAAIITRQSGTAARLVDDLLDVARVTSGKVVLSPRPIDLREVAHNSMRTLQLASTLNRHEITFDTSAEPIIVDADPVRLEQVASNLLTNAVKYTPEGGKIWLSVRREDGHGVLSVRDNGDGISQDILPRVFEPFVQAEQQLARSKGGLGLGLTVVHTIVRMHGGVISARSDGPGKGSEFTMRLPLAMREAPPPAEARLADEGVCRRILLVEDNTDAARAMQRLLTLWGHRIEVAASGAAAVAQAIASRPECMLIDIGLPDIDGYEVARRTRVALGDSIQLIAITGYGQPEDQRRAKEAGFNFHLVKPVSPQQLRQLLANC